MDVSSNAGTRRAKRSSPARCCNGRAMDFVAVRVGLLVLRSYRKPPLSRRSIFREPEYFSGLEYGCWRLPAVVPVHLRKNPRPNQRFALASAVFERACDRSFAQHRNSRRTCRDARVALREASAQGSREAAQRTHPYSVETAPSGKLNSRVEQSYLFGREEPAGRSKVVRE